MVAYLSVRLTKFTVIGLLHFFYGNEPLVQVVSKVRTPKVWVLFLVLPDRFAFFVGVISYLRLAFSFWILLDVLDGVGVVVQIVVLRTFLSLRFFLLLPLLLRFSFDLFDESFSRIV